VIYDAGLILPPSGWCAPSEVEYEINTWWSGHLTEEDHAWVEAQLKLTHDPEGPRW
jgi:hypothetical protein